MFSETGLCAQIETAGAKGVVIPSGVEGPRSETLKVTSTEPLDVARDDREISSWSAPLARRCALFWRSNLANETGGFHQDVERR
jgi:hypothetical protein